jgi:CheY-like chemotaxis protein
MAKIKVIDDDPDQVAYLSGILTGAGYEVTTFDMIDGAMESIEADRPDLILLDVMFPENPSGGMELAILIRRNAKIKHLPVILLTNINREFPIGISSKDIDAECMPVEDFIEKPANAQELLRKISKHLKKG